MDRRSWLWRRKSSEKSPGETESSGSISSHSERYSDDQQDMARASPNHSTQSPEVTSKSIAGSEVNDSVKKSPASGEEINDSMRGLTEKLSAALLNIKAKEDLVKQHAKVAEEAVSGWEKAENEVVALKQQLEVATQKNSALEDRVGHLDGALKECVRQLRQAREEQEQKVHEAIVKKTHEWESAKFELESQLVEFQHQVQAAKAEAAASVLPDLRPQLEAAEKANSALKLELLARAEDLEIRILERDLSTQAAEAASKQHLESIKKVTKLEAECRRLKSMARKASSYNDHKSGAASSIYVESLTDSQSDSGERLLAVETDTRKLSSMELNECEPSCSDSWASALIAELDQFKSEKAVGRNFIASSANIDLMDDFLEMERLASLPDSGRQSCGLELGAISQQPSHGDNTLNKDLEAMIQRTAELEEKLEKTEAEKHELEERLEKMEGVKDELQEKLEDMETVKTKLEEKLEKMEAEKAGLEKKLEKMEAVKKELEMALAESRDKFKSSQYEIGEAKEKLEELQTTLALANKLKQAAEVEIEAANTKREVVESHLMGVEAEVRTLRSKVDSLEAEVEKERTLSAEFEAKYHKLEEELSRKKQEAELCRGGSLNGDLKVKQDKEMAVAAGKLAECQKTIASLGQKLKSLATLEDFLVDSDKPLQLPEGGSPIPFGSESWTLHSNDVYLPKNLSTPVNGKDKESPQQSSSSSSSSASSSHVTTSEKSRNGFGKLFSRGKSGIRIEINEK